MYFAQRKPYSFLKINPWDFAQTLNLHYELVKKNLQINSIGILTLVVKKLFRLERLFPRSYMDNLRTNLRTNWWSLSQTLAITGVSWCEKGDSNPHTLRHKILNLACLPVPPLSQFCKDNILSVQSRFMFRNLY